MIGFTVITNNYQQLFDLAFRSGALIKINESLTDEYDNFTLLFDSQEEEEKLRKLLDELYETF